LNRTNGSIPFSLRSARENAEEANMRNVINTIANVTTNAIVNRTVRTVLAGVDALRASWEASRLYAAPASGAPDWADCHGGKPMAGKQKFAGPMCQHEQLSCLRRAHSRCRRPRLSSCLSELS
jgi:hypothetical protein